MSRFFLERIQELQARNADLLDFVKAFHHLCTVHPDSAALMVEPDSDMLRRADELIKQGGAS